MGASCSRDDDIEGSRQTTRSLHRKRSTGLPRTQTSLGDGTLHPLSGNRTLQDFNVGYTDFIGEKKGKITDYYDLSKPPIGKGACAEVKKAVHKMSGMMRAIKIIYKNATDKVEHQRLINEVNILKNLDHPNIMKIYEFYEDEGHFYIVSEYLDGGELFDKVVSMRYFSEKQAAITMKQILSAVSYCHTKNIVHRDLKPENILYESKDSNANIKVIDFGASRVYDHLTHMKNCLGTPYYVAPEVLKEDYTEKCDVWSCGVIMYILLCGFPPFSAETDSQVLRKVAIGKFTFDEPEWNQISNKAKNLITRMLEVNPEKRCTAEEALNDPWFASALEKPKFDKPLTVSTLTNLRKFKTQSRLQRATWIFLVTYFATRKDQAELLKTFQALDLNGDGQLSREELMQGYQTYMNSDDPKAEVDAIMNSVDINRSGKIDYTEFVIATINRENMLKKEKLEALFKVIDKDGNGYLTANELEEVFNPGKQRLIDANVWTELIKEVDKNKDGKLCFNEFKDMMNAFT